MNIDRLGVGASSKPPSALILADVSAATLHQVVQQLRPGFRKVIMIGHSLGSGLTQIEAAGYHDLDGMIITGISHLINAGAAAPVFGSLLPVRLAHPRSAKARDWGLDAGYLTTRPGTRDADFHQPSQDGPDAIRYDEDNWDAVPAAEVPGVALELTPVTTRSRVITTPVLSVIGQRDAVLCGLLGGTVSTLATFVTDCSSSAALTRSEQRYYPKARSFTAFVVPGAGHSMTFAAHAPDYYPVAINWTKGL
ncbi:alpha/beta hydrolase [Pseudonocardiaceae bacterium YIM PH 21723]|nr:alpha/beta hydrolase [Pseudonocardiaceae bacterium YIM PH 21723]